MIRNLIIAAAILAAVIAALGGTKMMQFKKLTSQAYVPPPESVSSSVVREEHWQDTLQAIGSIAAVQGVSITPEIAGTVTEIAFESGAVVNKGDLLVRLDTSSEEAQLRSIEAQANLARINVQRARSLREGDTVSQSELDTAEAAVRQHEASADAIRATIAKKTIRAPFAGQLGIRLVNLGQYLDAGQPIVSLQSLDPVYVDFSLPQQELAHLKTGMKVRVTTDTYTNQPFEGTLTAINPDLNSSTRSVRLQATLENPRQLLRPGMFANIAVLLPTRDAVLAIPATSVLSAPYGDSVYVIEQGTNQPNPGLVVRQQFIRTARTRGDFVAVTTGLQAGQRIVSSGLFKLRNGMAVVENNEISPKPSETPVPPDR